MLSRFWSLRGWWVRGGGRGVWVGLLKEKDLWQKSFYQTLLNEVLKICKKWCLLMLKLIKTTRYKRFGGCILHIFKRSTFETWNTMYKRHVFFIWFWFVFYPFWSCPLAYYRKNPKRGVEDSLFWKNPWNFSFFCLTLGNSRENKAPPTEISQNCVRSLGNSKTKNQDPWKFHMSFFWYRGISILSTPCLVFSWNSPSIIGMLEGFHLTDKICYAGQKLFVDSPWNPFWF